MPAEPFALHDLPADRSAVTVVGGFEVDGSGWPRPLVEAAGTSVAAACEVRVVDSPGRVLTAGTGRLVVTDRHLALVIVDRERGERQLLLASLDEVACLHGTLVGEGRRLRLDRCDVGLRSAAGRAAVWSLALTPPARRTATADLLAVATGLVAAASHLVLTTSTDEQRLRLAEHNARLAWAGAPGEAEVWLQPI